MADRADLYGPSEWDWIRKSAWNMGGTLTFARGVSPARVISAFGMNPANARLIPASRVEQAIRYPDWRETYPPDHPWIRAGVVGDWGFAIDESSSGYGGYEHDAAFELSAGTDVVLFSHNMALDHFHYYVNDTEVTEFEPLLAWDRGGTDPDRFVPQMSQVGLRIAPAPPDADFRNPVIALLEMLTLALGIRLPREVALGPLLTVQRD